MASHCTPPGKPDGLGEEAKDPASMRPLNPLVTPVLTDMYQISMAYAYWKAGRAEEDSVFDLFFRKNPFKGEYTIFAGLSEALALINSFSFSDDEVKYLRRALPHSDDAFFTWLAALDCSKLKVYALREGSVCFPRIALMRIEGPLALCQLLETTLLNCINYPSLVATNARRHRIAAGESKEMLEFGLRRAQGPDGALSASRYSYMGGFDGTSNVLAGKLLGIPCKGTHAHAFVQSYRNFDEIKDRILSGKDFVALVESYRTHPLLKDMGFEHTNLGELAAFTGYALAFPRGFLALVDTYDTLSSGVPNFLMVTMALDDLGFRALGIRLDSGDLAFLSREARSLFTEVGRRLGRGWAEGLKIVVSNDINESVIYSLNEQGHDIDTFGVGTNLVTCQAQPALGCVYKLVEIGGVARIKLSQSKGKVSLPGKKMAYRLGGADGHPLLDLIMLASEAPPVPHEQILCRHPFEATKRAFVTPSSVEPLHELVWDGANGGLVNPEKSMPSIHELRQRVKDGVAQIRRDSIRAVNATPYKVSLSVALYDFLHELWEKEAPIKEIR